MEAPPAIADASLRALLDKPPGATLQADRVVGSVPGHIVDVGQLLMGRGVGSNAFEGILAVVPSPLNDVQEHGHVPVVVEEETVAQEGEVDIPDLPE